MGYCAHKPHSAESQPCHPCHWMIKAIITQHQRYFPHFRDLSILVGLMLENLQRQSFSPKYRISSTSLARTSDTLCNTTWAIFILVFCFMKTRTFYGTIPGSVSYNSREVERSYWRTIQQQQISTKSPSRLSLAPSLLKLQAINSYTSGVVAQHTEGITIGHTMQCVMHVGHAYLDNWRITLIKDIIGDL